MAATPLATPATPRPETVIMSVPDDIADQLGDPDNLDEPVFKDLHTERPEMTVGERRLLGRYVQVVGSDLIFDPIKLQENAGYTACCRRRLVFEHARDHHDPLFQNHDANHDTAANNKRTGEEQDQKQQH